LAPAGRAYLTLAVAGFRLYATYRQAMVAASVTNTVFGFLRFAVMLAVIDTGARTVAGYDEPQLATFVWAGQGLIGVVLLWAPPDLAERIRTGDVATVEAFPTLKPSAVVLEFEEVTTTPVAPRGCPAPAG
jgi:ABC-2 type transport system permease protein